MFRNGRLGALIVPLRGDWFSTCPTSGTLHMDYLSMTKPLAGTKGDPPVPPSTNIYPLVTPLSSLIIIYTLGAPP